MPLSEMYRRGLVIAVVATAAGLAYSAWGHKAPRAQAPGWRHGTPPAGGIVLGRRTVPIACATRAADHDGGAAGNAEPSGVSAAGRLTSPPARRHVARSPSTP